MEFTNIKKAAEESIARREAKELARIWGMNPNATARIYTAAGWERIESGSVSGCGYDKESTAAANALNRSASVKKALYITFEKALQANTGATLGEALGYGSGYDALPYLEGGVGVSCFARILERCGYRWKYIASGKRFAVYSVAVA